MIDVGLAVSHDGINFTHIGGREAFIGPQASGAFDSKFQWMLPYPVVKEDGEIFYYYSYDRQARTFLICALSCC